MTATSTMVALVGEQPIPVLLPIKALKPTTTILVYTPQTELVAKRVARLLEGNVEYCPLSNAYDVRAIQEQITAKTSSTDQVTFNITGGTKIMMLAANALATEAQSPLVYYQTEGPRGRDQQSVLYRYRIEKNGRVSQEDRQKLPPLIKLDDYLQAHVEKYNRKGFSTDKGGPFEEAVFSALEDVVDEVEAGIKPEGVKEQVEIDLLVRCGNQVAVLEVKGGGEDSGKKAVDQLTTAAAREYLGTYAARFLIIGRQLDPRYKPLAQALRVRVIELPDYRGGRSLSKQDTLTLRRALGEHLPCPQNKR